MHPLLPMENTNRRLIFKFNIIFDGYNRKRVKLTGAINTQCKFLGHPRSIQIVFPGTKPHTEPEICKACPKDYNPTKEERSEYCIGTNFKKCARHKAAVQTNKDKSIKKAKG